MGILRWIKQIDCIMAGIIFTMICFGSHVPIVPNEIQTHSPSVHIRCISCYTAYFLIQYNRNNLSRCRLNHLHSVTLKVSIRSTEIQNLHSISCPSHFNPFKTFLINEQPPDLRHFSPLWGNEIDFLHFHTKGSLGNNIVSGHNHT